MMIEHPWGLKGTYPVASGVVYVPVSVGVEGNEGIKIECKVKSKDSGGFTLSDIQVVQQLDLFRGGKI